MSSERANRSHKILTRINHACARRIRQRRDRDLHRLILYIALAFVLAWATTSVASAQTCTTCAPSCQVSGTPSTVPTPWNAPHYGWVTRGVFRTQCNDCFDNDGDGFIDNRDPGCFRNPADPCTYDPYLTREDAATTQCQDKIDNDHDGFVDLVDPGCSGPSDNDESDTPTTTQCQDQIDNDSDGLIDLADPGCTGPLDNDERNQANTQCTDGIDNDHDILVDAQDPGCWSDPSNPATYNPQRNNEAAATTQCQDHADNDGDRLIDLADPGCVGPFDNDESNAGKTECNDGVDNDNDRLTDAQDPGCWQNPADPKTYNPLRDDEAATTTQCQDMRDNDQDGFFDLADPGCTSPFDNDESGDRITQCRDRVDNDQDNLTDAQDPGCWDDFEDPQSYNPLLDDESADGDSIVDPVRPEDRRIEGGGCRLSNPNGASLLPFMLFLALAIFGLVAKRGGGPCDHHKYRTRLHMMNIIVLLLVSLFISGSGSSSFDPTCLTCSGATASHCPIPSPRPPGWVETDTVGVVFEDVANNSNAWYLFDLKVCLHGQFYVNPTTREIRSVQTQSFQIVVTKRRNVLCQHEAFVDVFNTAGARVLGRSFVTTITPTTYELDAASWPGEEIIIGWNNLSVCPLPGPDTHKRTTHTAGFPPTPRFNIGTCGNF